MTSRSNHQDGIAHYPEEIQDRINESRYGRCSPEERQMRQVLCRMPEELADALQEIAADYGIKRGQLIRIACTNLIRNERNLNALMIVGDQNDDDTREPMRHD